MAGSERVSAGRNIFVECGRLRAALIRKGIHLYAKVVQCNLFECSNVLNEEVIFFMT